MNSFIDRDKLIQYLREYKINDILISTDELEIKGYNDGIDLAISVISEFSSTEPERMKGKWIDGMLYYDFDESEWEKVKCSACKNFVVKQIFYHDNKYHYCPYCGADMRGNQWTNRS